MATLEELEAIFNEEEPASGKATLDELEAIHAEGPDFTAGALLGGVADTATSAAGALSQGIADPTSADPSITNEALLEAGGAMASGFGRAMSGGLMGIAGGIGTTLTQGPEAGMVRAAEIVKDIQSNAFQPETEGGKVAMQKIGELAKSGLDVANASIGQLVSLAGFFTGKSDEEQFQAFEEVKQKGISQFLGDNTLEETGSPALATMAHIGPEAIAARMGFKSGPTARVERAALKEFNRSVRASKSLIDPNTGVIQPGFQKALAKYDISPGSLVGPDAKLPVIYSGNTPDKVVENIIKKQINTNNQSSHLAKIRLDKAGNIVDDDLGILAAKHGFDQGDIAAVKSANMPTRAAEKEMLTMQRAILANKSNVDRFRPSDRVGDSVKERIDFVSNEARRLSKQLDKMASKELTVSGRNLIGDGKNRLKGLEIDPTAIEKTVFDELDRLGIEGLGDMISGQGPNVTDAVLGKTFFDGSKIAVDKTSQRIIKDVFKLLKHNPDGPIDALKAHNVKRQIDSLIDFNKKSSQGLTEEGRRFAKAVRHSMNESVRKVSPKYAKINDDLSMSLQALNDIENSVGRRIDLFDKGANQAMGTEMRKLLSNYGTRQTLNNSLNGIDDAARALGGSFGTDFRELNRFANVLDRRFGSVAENSFKGNIDAALDLNRLRNTSIKEAVVEKGLSKIADKFGPNDQKAFDAMQKLLVRGK